MKGLEYEEIENFVVRRYLSGALVSHFPGFAFSVH